MTSNAEHIATLKEIRRFVPGSEQEAALDAAVEALAPAGECACPKHNGQHLYPCTNPPPPFPLPASPAAVEAWFPAYVVHEMMQMAYRAALPPAGSQLRCANQIEAADTILAMEANRAILSAPPPAAPVVSESDALLIERAKDRRDMLLNWRQQMPAVWYGNSTLDGAAKVIDELMLRLSVPATDDKAPAVDAEPVLPCDVIVAPATRIRAGCKVSTLLHCIETRRANNNFPDADAEAFGNLLRDIRETTAAPTSPHDVDAGHVATLENLRDRVEMGGDISSRHKRPKRVAALNAAIAALTAALRKPGPKDSRRDCTCEGRQTCGIAKGNRLGDNWRCVEGRENPSPQPGASSNG